MIARMSSDAESADVVVGVLPEVTHVRIGGSAGLRVTQSSVSSTTTHKRVTPLNDAESTVRMSRALLEELHAVARSGEPDALERIRAMLPTVEL